MKNPKSSVNYTEYARKGLGMLWTPW